MATRFEGIIFVSIILQYIIVNETCVRRLHELRREIRGTLPGVTLNHDGTDGTDGTSRHNCLKMSAW